jgi:hypothetical protein
MSFWTSTSIAYSPYKDFKDVFILQSNEELYNRIEECRTQLNIICESKYSDCVMNETEKQKKMFSTLEDLL